MNTVLIADKDKEVAECVSGLLPKDYFDETLLFYSQKGVLEALASDTETKTLLTGMELEDGSSYDLCMRIRGNYRYEDAFERVIPKGETPDKLSGSQRREIFSAQINIYAEDFFGGNEEKALKLFQKRRMPIILMLAAGEYPYPDPLKIFSAIVEGKPTIKDGKINYYSGFQKNLESEIERLTQAFR